MKKLIFFALLSVLSLGALAQSQGNANGQPFQELQSAVDRAITAEAGAREAADAAEAAARAAADTAEAAARAAADLAESTTRAAQDAALAAEIAAEEVARIAADIALQGHINAEIAARLALEERVSILEDFHFTGRSVTYVETAGKDVFDFSAINGLNYQAGEWVLLYGYYAYSDREIALCSNHPAMESFLNTPPGARFDIDVWGGPDDLFNVDGTGWYPGAGLGLHRSDHDFMYHDFYSPTNQMSARTYGQDKSEVLVYVAGQGGYYTGNTFTISVAQTRLEACGF
jgi:hypothetical protein